jgi:hypothetical protein
MEQLIIIPSGHCSIPAMFEQLMESVLQGLTFEACLVYLHDVTVGGRTFQEQPDNAQKVLQRL